MQADSLRSTQERLLAEVMQRTGVRLSVDDPAFAVVELARLSFEDSVQANQARTASVVDAIEAATRKAAGEITRASLGAISTDTRLAREALVNETQQAICELRIETAQARTRFNSTLSVWMRDHAALAKVRYRIVAFCLAFVLLGFGFATGLWIGWHAHWETRQ